MKTIPKVIVIWLIGEFKRLDIGEKNTKFTWKSLNFEVDNEEAYLGK